jgi:hypothetical protein
MTTTQHTFTALYFLMYVWFFGVMFNIFWEERHEHDGWFWSGLGGLGCLFLGAMSFYF